MIVTPQFSTHLVLNSAAKAMNSISTLSIELGGDKMDLPRSSKPAGGPVAGMKNGGEMSPHTGPGRTDSYVKDSKHFVQRICKSDEEDVVSSIEGVALTPGPLTFAFPWRT